jgi:hypothetical protein
MLFKSHGAYGETIVLLVKALWGWMISMFGQMANGDRNEIVNPNQTYGNTSTL